MHNLKLTPEDVFFLKNYNPVAQLQLDTIFIFRNGQKAEKGCFYKYSEAVEILLNLLVKRSTQVIFLIHHHNIINKTVHLLRFEACEAEHPNLVGDVLPVVGGAFVFQTSHQLFSHLNDAICHAVHLLQPVIKRNRF